MQGRKDVLRARLSKINRSRSKLWDDIGKFNHEIIINRKWGFFILIAVNA